MPLNNIETLIIIPTKMELDAFIKEYSKKGMHHESITLDILQLNEFAELRTDVTPQIFLKNA